MLSYLHGKPEATADFKSSAEDFNLNEFLNFEPSGSGEHLLIQVEKRNTNTHFVAKQLAVFAGAKIKDVSYAGLKDRYSVSTQWFGIWLPGKKDPDFKHWHLDEVKILKTIRHNKKLRLGAITHNQFTIVLRNLNNYANIETRLQQIARQGVPNYYGEQRFGRYDDNVEMAKAMFAGTRVKDRKKRSIYLSAARSYLFNLSVAHRIDWQSEIKPLVGDVLMLGSSRSFFHLDDLTADIESRFEQKDVVLSVPLVGKGELASSAEIKIMEEEILSANQELVDGLSNAGLKQERRRLLLLPKNLNWQLEEDKLTLTFDLAAGEFATTILRELVDYKDISLETQL